MTMHAMSWPMLGIRWARRCAELTADKWSTPTRCRPWDVRALVAHVCPDPGMFDKLDAARIDAPAAVTDGADLLRRFNEPDGIAHTMADDLAQQALSDAEELTSEDAVHRFTESARTLRSKTMSGDIVIE
jgi:hypothetical protein